MLIPKGDVSVTPAGCRAEIDRRELSLQEEEVERAQAATRVSRLNEGLSGRQARKERTYAARSEFE